MDWLLYWKDYWNDKWEYGSGGVYRVIYHTRNQHLYKSLRPGDNVWLVVSRLGRNRGKWALAMRLVVARKSRVKAWRPYRFFPNFKQSEIYEIEDQDNIGAILRSLEFVGGRRIKTKGARIGRSLQSPRRLIDAAAMRRYSQGLTKIKGL